MAQSIDDFRSKLFSKILNADSENAALRFVDKAIRTLSEKTHRHIIVRFLDKVGMDIKNALSVCPGENQRKNLESALKKIEIAGRNMRGNVNNG